MLRVIPQLGSITENAIPAYFEAERDPKKSSNIVGFHSYVAKVDIDGKDYFVRITAQELRIGHKKIQYPDQLHSAFISDVEIVEAGIESVSSKIIDLATETQTSFDSKLAQFLENAKKSAETTSKVVDENGEPLVVYSGHSNFELYGDKYQPKRGTSGGFYASESPDVASNYSTGKMGNMEGYEDGSQYVFQLKNGKFGSSALLVQRPK